MRLSVVLFLITISTLLPGSHAMTSTLVFPSETSNTYVELVPRKEMILTAYTLCMRVATELSGEREVILFAYRSRNDDELNVWRARDGRLSLYMTGDGVFFKVPQLSALETHLCITWDSSSGATTVFMDGKKSLTKIYRKGHSIYCEGIVLLGQDADVNLGEFDVNQSFVGVISDVNMWDSVLPESKIQDIFSGRKVPRGNIFDWETTRLRITGAVEVVNHEL